jgi:O-antigen/teichoic acid export membrane protein
LGEKALNFLRNFSFTLTSNLIVMIVSALVVFIVPKLIGVEEYGYWQLFLFYSSFVPFLQFGWNDGIYLRYGGKEYSELDKGLFFSQFILLVISQLLIAVCLYFYSNYFILDSNKILIFQFTAFYLFLVNVRYMLLFILQGTNRIQEYAKITISDKILYCLLLIVFLVYGVRDYKLLIAADLVGKIISLSYAIYCCRDIVFRKLSTFYFSFKEIFYNISVGIKLMFSNTVSMLSIGVVRLGIERTWDVSTFGKVSLTLNISNFVMIFISAVGTVLFPVLRRVDAKELPSIYQNMRTLLMVILLGILIVYHPIKMVFLAWLPKYEDSLIYMALVFPMCVYEGKMSLLVNTYLKTLRKEKVMLIINLILLVLSVLITIITTQVSKSLNLTILSIVILLAFRSIIAEIYLSKILGIIIYKDIAIEIIMTLIFILVGWFVKSWVSVTLYPLTYIFYMVIKRKEFFSTIKTVKLLMRN